MKTPRNAFAYNKTAFFTALFCATALFLTAQPARTAEIYKSSDVNLIIDGDITTAIFITGQDDNIDADGTVTKYSTGQVRADGRLGIQAETFLDNGYKVGTRFEFELTGDIEQAYIFMSGPFGELHLGQIDNVSVFLQLYAPEFLAPAIDTVDYPDFQAYGRSSVGTGPQFGDSTFITYDEVSHKLNYISPRIAGLQFGVGWTPDPTATFDNSSDGGLQGRIEDDSDGYNVENIVTFTANYIQETQGVTWGLSGTYLIGGDKNVPNTTPTAYNIGASASWEGWEIGGTWQQSRDLMINDQGTTAADDDDTGPDATDPAADDTRIRDKVWAIGVRYQQDQWSIGAAYRNSRRDDDPSVVDKTNEEFEIGMAYNLGKGLWISGSVEYVNDFDPEQTASATLESVNGALLLTFQF